MTPGDPETERLFERFRGSDDESAREEVIKRFLPMAKRLADRYRHTSQASDDLLQVASLGLVKAVDRFDPTRGVKFTAFAVPTILGELRRHFRDMGWSVRVPRSLQERALQVERAASAVATSEGRSPSVELIAERLSLTVEEVLEAMQARQAFDALSMDAPISPADGTDMRMGDSIGSEDERLEGVEDRVAVIDALQRVPESERELLRLRFLEGMTQSEIAEQIGVSQMQVSRMLRRSLRKLREIAES